MTVHLTPEALAEKKRHKRLLESEELFPFAYRNGQECFYYVVYSRFGKATGSVILADHPHPAREDQLKAGWAFFHFNRVLSEAGAQLVKDIRRPVDLLEQIRRGLRQAQWNESFRLEPYADDLAGIQEALDIGIGTIGELNDLFLAMQALEKQVLDRQELRDEDVQRMIGYNIAHYRAMYRQGKQLLARLPAMERLQKHIATLSGSLEGEEEQLRQSLLTGLDALTTPSNVKVLEASNASFENDEQGRPIAMKAGVEGLDQHDELLRRKNDYVFHHIIIRDIRNLTE